MSTAGAKAMSASTCFPRLRRRSYFMLLTLDDRLPGRRSAPSRAPLPPPRPPPPPPGVFSTTGVAQTGVQVLYEFPGYAGRTRSARPAAEIDPARDFIQHRYPFRPCEARPRRSI